MMRSSFDEEDDFAPNPFRSSSSHDADLLGAPLPASSNTGNNNHPLSSTTTPMNVNTQMPDPQSGMTGTFIPASPAPAPPPPDPSQYLSGPMDAQRAAGGSTYGSSDEIPSTTPGFLSRCTSCFRLEGYQPYFDLDTVDFLTRFKAALTQFWQPDQFRLLLGADTAAATSGSNDPTMTTTTTSSDLKGPDLYGPLWITMTLIFCLAVTSNLSAYMHTLKHNQQQQSETQTQEFEYDINLLLRASTVVTLFSFGLPTVFWLACTCLGMPSIPWAMWVCVYGYSLTPYVIASWLAWIWAGMDLWVYLVLGLATAASVLLVLRNLSTLLLAQDAANQAKAAPVIMSILGTHVVFLLVLKFGFYSG